jgi:hypothetical protein
MTQSANLPSQPGEVMICESAVVTSMSIFAGMFDNNSCHGSSERKTARPAAADAGTTIDSSDPSQPDLVEYYLS